MTIRIISYNSREEFLRDEPIQARAGFHLLHYDSPHKVTWDNTPEPTPPPARQLTETAYVIELATRDNVVII